MSFSNPPVPWEELSRVLAGAPPHDSGPRGRIHTVPSAGPSKSALLTTPLPMTPSTRVPYAELHCHSAFSFLDGASTPEQLVAESVRLGLDALALTDHNGFYGAVRFAEAAREAGLKTLYGAELSLNLPAPQFGQPDPAGEHLLVLARGQEGYRRLSRQLAQAHLRGGEKGRPVYDLDELADAAGGHWLILTGCRKGAVRQALAHGYLGSGSVDSSGGHPDSGSVGHRDSSSAGGLCAAERAMQGLIDRFGRDNVAVELTCHREPTDDEDNDALAHLAEKLKLSVVATTAAHYATPHGSRLGAAVAAVHARRDLAAADPYLPAGPGAHLRSGAEMAQLFARYPKAVENAAALGADCAFDLHLVAPQLPPYSVPENHNEASYLRELTMAGAARRYGSPERNAAAYAQINKELRMIEQLNFPGYFLVVWDIVQFCHRANILCQGRGSAANSAVCYALGITAVDAVSYGLLFERFLSPVREGPPDIDVDIEARRREEVIQYVYAKYGRDRAAQVANVATFRSKMAVRDMAGALGYSPGQRDAYSKGLSHWGTLDEQVTNHGVGSGADHGPNTNHIDAGAHEIPHSIPQEIVGLAMQIQGFPRHLGIHSGGMVICDRPVADVCPVEWARKEGRSVLQWDKDDCAAIGLVKFDLLGLGMLSALHEAIDLVKEHQAIDIDFAALDLEEPAIYEMLRRADAIGVFQVESRAQLATLPRLKPERFYDLVVEIALIRPGPIQGGSVHPYLARRDAVRTGTWRGPFVEHPAMGRALNKTLGIPLFQEQLMELAIDIAGFDAGQADQLRRAMGSKRSTEKMQKLRADLYRGMRDKNGITGDLADSIFERLQAFANFGFAESHALSFAALVFYSAYLKLHHPAAFLAGLLRSQPMGFYSPQSLVADARRHGVTVHRAHVNRSGVQTGLEPGPDGRPTARLGIGGIRGIGTDLAAAIVAARPAGGYRDITELTLAVQRSSDKQLSTAQVEALATAGALDGLGGSGSGGGVLDSGGSGDGTSGGGSGSAELDSGVPGSMRRAALWAAGTAAAMRPGMLQNTVIHSGAKAEAGTDADSAPNQSGGAFDSVAPTLPGMSDIELTLADIWATGISPDAYPTEFSRGRLTHMGIVTTAGLYGIEPGTRVHVAGIVTHRQRPSTAGGVTFINLEDETGMVNVICQPGMWRRYRSVARSARSLVVRGIIERDRGSLSLLADRMAAIDIVGALPSRDFR
ncbi:MAG: error-prone DNA polymerase [Nakamurella sp.]